MRKVDYINLTNGLDWKFQLDSVGSGYGLMRIQSTHCEQKRWDDMLYTLPDGFLMNLATGNEVIIYDTSPKHNMSRALWQGLPFIVGTLYRLWLGKETQVMFKTHNATEYFEQEYRKLSKKTISRLKYFKKFLNTDMLHVGAYCKRGEHDGDYEHYRAVLLGEKPSMEISRVKI